jgi:hypothetical protein
LDADMTVIVAHRLRSTRRLRTRRRPDGADGAHV